MVLVVMILGGVFITQRSITIANATATAIAIAEATADAERAATSTMQAWYTATAKIKQAATQVAQAATATIQFQRTATAQAKLNASATSKAKKTATAQYMIDILGSLVQPSQEGAEYLTNALQKATLIYGPASGQLVMKDDNFIEEKQANINEKNFIVTAKFDNPYSTSIHSWSYGFLFRNLEGSDQLRLIISSDGTWSFMNGTGENDKTITSDWLNNLDATSNGSNWIILICEEATGWFYVNDSYVAELDLSARTNSGDVSVATGFYVGDEIEGKYVRYDNFSIWSLK